MIFVRQNNYYVPIDTSGGQLVSVDFDTNIATIEAQFSHRDSQSIAESYWFVVMEKSKYSDNAQSSVAQRFSFDAVEAAGVLYSSYLPPNSSGNNDTDNDGLTNDEEIALNTDPTNPDTDNDGVEDAVEIEFSMDPNNADTDGDSFDDFFEFTNISEGYDPIVVNKEMNAWDYFKQISAGAAFGDFACTDNYNDKSIPCVIGAIGSGFIVWGDIVSIAYDGINGHFGWLVVDVAAIAPIVGDVAGTGGKIARFVTKNGLSSAPTKTLIKKIALKTDDSDFFVDVLKHVDEVSVNKLVSSGMDNKGIHRLAKGGMTPKELVDLVDGASDVRKVSSNATHINPSLHSGFDLGFADGFFTGKHGWKLAEDVVNVGSSATKGKSLRTAGNDIRFPDMYDVDNFIAKEAKTGRQTANSKILEQIRKDSELILDGDIDLRRVEWHFFPSGRSNTIGMTEGLKKALENARIPYIIHLP